MTEENDFDLTSGEGSILVEIDAELAPITPEVLQRRRVRPPYRWPGEDMGKIPPTTPPAQTDKPE
jgi:hypothetical protein